MATKLTKSEAGYISAQKRWGNKTPKERLYALAKVGKPDECWPWTGHKNAKGYGKMWLNGKCESAHRISFEIHVRPLQEGEWVLHTCDNPACINPHHFFARDVQANVSDMMDKGRNNQPKGENNHLSKLTSEAVRVIREAFSSSRTMKTKRALAARFCVSVGAIEQVVYGKTWKHV